MVKITLSIQIITRSLMLIGIPVDKIHGIEAEKNKIEEIDTIPAVNLETSSASFKINAGKNISAKELAIALLNSTGSGMFVTHAKG
tara:strand:- start:143 stop:400 length:258 start_codon:yes stop_codon:yes gene_type:complete